MSYKPSVKQNSPSVKKPPVSNIKRDALNESNPSQLHASVRRNLIQVPRRRYGRNNSKQYKRPTTATLSKSRFTHSSLPDSDPLWTLRHAGRVRPKRIQQLQAHSGQSDKYSPRRKLDTLDTPLTGSQNGARYAVQKQGGKQTFYSKMPAPEADLSTDDDSLHRIGLPRKPQRVHRTYASALTSPVGDTMVHGKTNSGKSNGSSQPGGTHIHHSSRQGYDVLKATSPDKRTNCSVLYSCNAKTCCACCKALSEKLSNLSVNNQGRLLK